MRKSVTKNSLIDRIDFNLPKRFPTGFFEADIESSNACEETAESFFLRELLALHSSLCVFISNPICLNAGVLLGNASWSVVLARWVRLTADLAEGDHPFAYALALTYYIQYLL